MKKIVLLILLSLALQVSAQQKYQSLLWEITGNGLKKPSYLYGTMHVSKKVAFRLDDIFFKALNSSESIALESDPSRWLGFSYQNSNFGSDFDFYSYGFYTKLFQINPPKQQDLRNNIRIDNRLISGYLYRKDFGSDNFEEETYLDMFIYQAGKKQHKPIIGLEDLAESRYLTTKASYNSNKKKPDAWLQKLFKKENPYFIQENTYRERNLDLLDSIGAASNTEFFRENMLYKRNENMVVVLDSIMPNQSVFSGVGAAHLPGEKGMINMLIERGYTVKPLTSDQTDYAKSEKIKLDNLLIKPELTLHKTPDGFLTIKSFDTLREFSRNGQKYYLAPDMTNGAFLAINRISLFEYLSQDAPISLDKIDHLLYEDIPGTIIKKERITAPFPGISILNKTKKGDYQKYHIYKTPLEIVIIKFGGKQDFVKQYEADIFNSISFKPNRDSWITYKDPFNKYSITLPENYTTQNMERTGKKSIEAKRHNDYYFFQESPHHDVHYIEEDAFEAKYIHTSFYKNLELEEVDGHFEDGTYKSYISWAVVDSLNPKKITLKSVVKDGSYYLLGYSGEHQEDANIFFNSLKFSTPTYESFKTVRDTSLHFTAQSPVKASLSFMRSDNDDIKPFDEQIKNATYTSKSNEEITVTRTKFHDLKMYSHPDSLWNNLEKGTKKGYHTEPSKKLEVFDEKRYRKNDLNFYTHKLKDSLSNKVILVKYIQKQGVLFKLSALTNAKSKPSPFITSFYGSFQPLDTLLGEPIFKDKSEQFFDALAQNDSIVLNGYSELEFSEKHSKSIMKALVQQEFPEDKSMIKYHLLKNLIEHDNSKTVTQFIENLYLKSYSDPATQRIILNALLQRRNKASYELCLSLMHKDLPLGSKTPNLSAHQFKADALKTVKTLFPELLEFSGVEEYKNPVYSLLVTLVDSNIVKTKTYKSHKNQIIKDAKIQIKRSLGTKQRYAYSRKKELSLDNYTRLLFPFRNEKPVRDFYLRLMESEDWEALTSYYTLLKQHNELVPESLKKKTLFEESAQHILFSKLKKQGLLGQETQIIDLKTFAKSRLFARSNFNSPKHTIDFLEEKKIITDTNKNLKLFIFKRKDKNNNHNDGYLHFIAFEEDKTEKPYYISNKNGVSVYGIKTDEDLIEDTIRVITHKTRERIEQNRY